MDYTNAIGYAHEQQRGAPNIERAQTDWDRAAGNLEQMLANVEQMTADMARIANHVFGSPPPSTVADGNKNPVYGGALDELHARHERLQAALAALWEQVERFRRLA